MLTEKDISKVLNKVIKAPIRVGKLSDLNINSKEFLEYYQSVFEDLDDDVYLLREKQIKLLKNAFPDEEYIIERFNKDYFEGTLTIDVFKRWISRLNHIQKQQFSSLSFITRKRNIASFIVQFQKEKIDIKRILESEFSQEVTDFRAWSRVFKQADSKLIENGLFKSLITAFANIVKRIHPEVKELKFSAHFMRTLSQESVIGENAPEGIHEDGSDYIVSALVVNRKNCVGAESQIYELKNDTKELLLSKELKIGEFIFQADTGEEKKFGNDLWHYVTGIKPKIKSQMGIRDVIGLDIKIIR